MKDKVSDFIVYENDSSEIAYVRRSSITSFAPRYVRKNCFRVLVTVGKETFSIYQAESVEAAKNWIHEQIAIIENGL